MAKYPHKVAIAPMMEWTDRHCRFFHRRLTRRALLHTEMITADAVIHGDRQRLLTFHPDEHPVAVQLAGSEPAKLAEAARIAADFGYDEINLNVGCPSDRVQSGRFGACLMREPQLVADLVAATKAAVPVPVTVKCRLGVDEQDPDSALRALAEAVIAAGADALWVHARKAWLSGLSPKENREIPPLDYGRVIALKTHCQATFIGINGGIADLDQAAGLLRQVDGVMLGRAAYHTPGMLAAIDHRFYAEPDECPEGAEAVRDMLGYVAAELAGGARLAAITRHMLGLFQGIPGARRWRQVLTVDAIHRDAGVATIIAALAQVTRPRFAAPDVPAAPCREDSPTSAMPA
jgi:tRNA-dihydrouridine synthase A